MAHHLDARFAEDVDQAMRDAVRGPAGRRDAAGRGDYHADPP